MNTRVEANRLLGCMKMEEESLQEEIISSLEAAKAVGAEQAAKPESKHTGLFINLSGAEVQSGLSRVRNAEGLIQQLPRDHDGRNTWLLNYGVGAEAIVLRKKRRISFDIDTMSAETVRFGAAQSIEKDSHSE